MRYMRRERFAIISEILYHALGGASKTSICDSCNLSTRIYGKYVAILLMNGLLEKNENLFYTTKKGKQFLTTYQKLEPV